MKSTFSLRLPAFVVLIALIPALQGCFKDKHIETLSYTANSPIYMPTSEFRNSIEVEGPRTIEEPGKIYLHNNMLFISETGEGIHVVDNSNPNNPQKLGFIRVPGNADIAVKGNALYADSYMDLVTIDISDINNVMEVDRQENVFQYTLPQWDPNYPIAKIDESQGVVVGWEIKKVTEKCENGECGWTPDFVFSNSVERDNSAFATFSGASNSGRIAVVGAGSGVGGSMARFMLYDEFLYVIKDDFNMQLFNTVDPMKPVSTGETNLGQNVETLFTYEDNLFVGSQFGMYIYSLDDPENPTYVSEIEHIQACDPVVVHENTAYVTVRSSNQCGSPVTVNQLDVIDVSNISNPQILRSYQMEEPFGLAIDGENEVLFICDGNAGLKAYSSSDPHNIVSNQVGHMTGFHAFDAIPLNGLLLMVGADGLYQFNYTDPSNISQVSVLPVGR